MKHIKLFENFLNESESDEMKRLAKELKFPSGSRILPTSISWFKRGGQAGSKSIGKTMQAAKSLGWKKESKQSSNATGDVVNNMDYLFDPNGIYKLSGYSRYGVTASENWFELKLEKLK